MRPVYKTLMIVMVTQRDHSPTQAHTTLEDNDRNESAKSTPSDRYGDRRHVQTDAEIGARQ